MKSFLIKIIFTASILFVSLSSFSQNTGFMGNRFIFNADIAVNPSILNPSFMAKNGTEGLFSYFHIYRFYHFNWLLSPNIEIIAWKKGSAGITAHYLKSYYSEDIIPFLATGCGLFYKHYFGENRAPVGSYIKVGFDIILPTPKETDSFLFYGAKIEFGKDFVFVNRIKLSIAGNLGLPFTGWKNMSEYRNSTNITQRLMGIYWLGVKLGLGVIAF